MSVAILFAYVCGGGRPQAASVLPRCPAGFRAGSVEAGVGTAFCYCLDGCCPAVVRLVFETFFVRFDVFFVHFVALLMYCCFVQNSGLISYVFVGIMLLRAHLHLRGLCHIPARLLHPPSFSDACGRLQRSFFVVLSVAHLLLVLVGFAQSVLYLLLTSGTIPNHTGAYSSIGYYAHQVRFERLSLPLHGLRFRWYFRQLYDDLQEFVVNICTTELTMQANICTSGAF